MKTISFLNEKNQPKQKVRSEVRSQVEQYLIDKAELVKGPNGLYMPVAIDETSGDTIYANVTFSISTADPTVKKEKKVKSAKTDAEPVVIENLFE